MSQVFRSLAVAGLIFFTSGLAFGQVAGQNRIEGIVWDPDRRPVADVYVELANAVEGDISRARTSGGGRFVFSGLSTGRFRLKVVAAGTNFLEEMQDVEIQGTGMGSSNETRHVDFHLKYDPRRVTFGSGGPPEAIFVQDVPDSAKKLYKRALPDLRTDKGLELMEQAIAAFPEYFDALSAAGREYVNRGDYVKGAPYLVRAVKLNGRSYSTFNSLAYAAYKLNKLPEAGEAARLALTLEPKVIGTRMLYARVLRLQKRYNEAEAVLAETKRLAPSMPDVYYELALVYNRQNRNAEAAEELSTYLKLLPAAADRKDVEDLIAKLKNS